MLTKIVYVLVSDDSDFYLEQLAISLFSLRKHNPDASVTVLTDKETNDTLSGNRRMILEFVNELKIVNTPPDFTKKMRSRFLKTNLRRLLDGDFLYIDVDTVICNSLSKIDETPYELAACREECWGKSSRFRNTHGFQIAEEMGWETLLKKEPYFNGGVIYAKDTASARSFFEEWYKQYKICNSKQVFTDQTALRMANKIKCHPIKILDPRWNYMAQSKCGYDILHATIIHYFHKQGRCNYCLARDSIFLSVREYGIHLPFIQDFIDNPRWFFVSYESHHFIRRHRILNKFYNSDSLLPRMIRRASSSLGHLLIPSKQQF